MWTRRYAISMSLCLSYIVHFEVGIVECALENVKAKEEESILSVLFMFLQGDAIAFLFSCSKEA